MKRELMPNINQLNKIKNAKLLIVKKLITGKFFYSNYFLHFQRKGQKLFALKFKGMKQEITE